MKIIAPFVTSNASLVSSTVSATDPYAAGSYNPATTYAAATVVQVDSPTFTFTVSGYLFTAAAHGYGNSEMLTVSSSGTLPPGLTAATRYYLVQATTNTYKLSLAKNGTPITTTGAGTGTHTATVSSHKLYESLLASNLANTPHKSPSYWLDIGNTNRWKCLDTEVASQTFQDATITYVIQTASVTDSLYLGNVNADSVTITARQSGGGAIVYGPTTYALRAPVATFFEWCFAPIKNTTEFAVTDLPTYYNIEFTIVLTRTSATVMIGTLMTGLSKTLGVTLMGASFSINDYSVKSTDEFGNMQFTERAFSKRGTFQVMIDRADVDSVNSALSQYRATPIVYIGSEVYASGIIFGKFNSFNTTVTYDTYSMCNIEIEGLT